MHTSLSQKVSNNQCFHSVHAIPLDFHSSKNEFSCNTFQSVLHHHALQAADTLFILLSKSICSQTHIQNYLHLLMIHYKSVALLDTKELSILTKIF